MAALMHRRIALIIAISCLLVTACGDEEDTNAPAAQATTTTPAAFPVTVEGKLGTAEIPAEPKRVVALGSTDADVAVALGVTPLAVPKYAYAAGRDAPWLAPRLEGKDVKELDATEPSLEAIAALRPDVILATTFYGVEKVYDQLARIAPVVSYEAGSSTDSWQTQATRIGRALGREEQAKEVVASVEARIAKERDAHPGFQGATFTSSFHFAPGQVVTLNSPDDFAVKILGGLGLELSPAADRLKGDGGAQISLERLADLDADALLIAYADEKLQSTLEASAIFKRIPAVRAGHDVTLSLDATTALRNPSVLSIPYGLDQLVPSLGEALGG
jgi:iron complex transport system substrate-binding protein